MVSTTPTHGLQLLDLTAFTCRWPIGDPGEPGFHFCGAACPEHKPYCAEHTMIARREPKDERS